LDVLMERAPFAQAAGELLDLAEQGVFEAYLAAITPLNIFYIARKAKSRADLRQTIQDLLQTLRVCAIDESILTTAFKLEFSDYEDAVQHCCATANNLEAIITRNVRDYENATLPIFTPSDFLRHLESQQKDQT